MNRTPNNISLNPADLHKIGELLKNHREQYRKMNVNELIPKLSNELELVYHKKRVITKSVISKIENGEYTRLGQEYAYCYAKAIGADWDALCEQISRKNPNLLISKSEKQKIIANNLKKIQTYANLSSGYALDCILMATDQFVRGLK